eukprot:8307_1
MAAASVEEIKDIGAWSEKEDRKANEVRKRIRDLIESEKGPEDAYLHTEYAKSALSDPWVAIKFLRLAYQNPKDAANKFHECLKWRRDYEVDTILGGRWPRYDEMKSKFPFCWHGTSRFGNPVHIDSPGNLKLKDLVETHSVPELVRYHVQIQEYMVRSLMVRQTAKMGHRIHQINVIVDLQGLGMAQMSSVAHDYLKRASEIDQEYYPDAMSQLFIINAPWIFTTMWKVIKLFLNERTKKKIKILGSNYLEEISKVIEVTQIPAFMGGKCPNNCTSENFWECHEYEREFRAIVTRTGDDERTTEIPCVHLDPIENINSPLRPITPDTDEDDDIMSNN